MASRCEPIDAKYEKIDSLKKAARSLSSVSCLERKLGYER
jgi:hypothetical protein